MSESLDVTVKRSVLGSSAGDAAVVMFHPDPSQLDFDGGGGGRDDHGCEGFESLTISLTDCSGSRKASTRIISLTDFLFPVLYNEGEVPYPALIMPLSFNSLAYAGLARPEGLQLFLGALDDPMQRRLRTILGEGAYNDLLRAVCYYTEGEYTADEAVKALQKLYSMVLATVAKIHSVIAKTDADSDAVEGDRRTLVNGLLAELVGLKRPLFTFEQAAQKIANEALFITPFLNVVGITPGSPILLIPGSFLWLGPGDYMLIEFPGDEDATVTAGFLKWVPSPQACEEAYNLVLRTTFLNTCLPRQYAFECDGYNGELKCDPLNMSIYDFEIQHNENKLIKSVSTFDSYRVVLRNGATTLLSIRMHVVPVGNKAYTFTTEDLRMCPQQCLYVLLLRGIFQLDDKRILAPSYQRIKGLESGSSMTLTPMGLSTPGAISCVILGFDTSDAP